MTSIDRSLGPWLALTWGILATGAWAYNGVIAIATDSAPSMDTVLIASSLTMTGLSIGVTLNVVVGFLRSRRPLGPDVAAADEAALWMMPMGVGILGLAFWSLFEPTSGITDWLLLVVGFLVSGFVIGASAGAPLRKYITTAARPGGRPVAPKSY